MSVTSLYQNVEVVERLRNIDLRLAQLVTIVTAMSVITHPDANQAARNRAQEIINHALDDGPQ